MISLFITSRRRSWRASGSSWCESTRTPSPWTIPTPCTLAGRARRATTAKSSNLSRCSRITEGGLSLSPSRIRAPQGGSGGDSGGVQEESRSGPSGHAERNDVVGCAFTIKITTDRATLRGKDLGQYRGLRGVAGPIAACYAEGWGCSSLAAVSAETKRRLCRHKERGGWILTLGAV
eukprot:1184682-Prorocentrum_minimum.AAC.7